MEGLVGMVERIGAGRSGYGRHVEGMLGKAEGRVGMVEGRVGMVEGLVGLVEG